MRRVTEGRDYYSPPVEEYPSPHATRVSGGFDTTEEAGYTTAARYRKRLNASGQPVSVASSYDRQPAGSSLRYRGITGYHSAEEPNPSDLTFQRLHHQPRAAQYDIADPYDSHDGGIRTAPLALNYDYSQEDGTLPLARRDYGYGASVEPYTLPQGPAAHYDRVVEVPPYAGRIPAVATLPSRALVRAESPPRPAPSRKKLPLVPRVAQLARKPAAQFATEPARALPPPPPQPAPSAPPGRPASSQQSRAVVPAPDDYIPPYARYIDKNTERYSQKSSSKVSGDRYDVDPYPSTYTSGYQRDPYGGAAASRPSDRGSSKYGSSRYDAPPYGSRPSDRYSGDLPDNDVYEKPNGKFVPTLEKYEQYDAKYGDRYPSREEQDYAVEKHRPAGDIDIDHDSDLEESDRPGRHRPKYDDYDVDDEDRFDPRPEDHPEAGTLRDDYDELYKPKPYQPPPTFASAAGSSAAGSSPAGLVRYVVFGLGALVALYVLTKAMSWVRGRPGGRLNCGSYEYAACKDQGCSYDPERRSCFLPSPHEIVREAGFKAPYRFLFLGHPSAETRTCINSMARAYGSSQSLGRAFDARDYYTSTSMDQLHLYDTPPMDLTTDIDAFYKVRKFVGGVEHGQNFTRHPFSWVNDKAHAASRVVLVLDIRPAVKGWVWHSVRHSGIASFTAQLEKVDTALPVSPLVLINTMGYKAKTANKVREALKRAYRLDHSSVFNVDCSYISPLDLSKILYSVFLDNKYTSMRLESFAL
eukprot:EG_transcript_2970